MQKYMVISFFLLLVMNGTVMSMRIGTKLYSNQKHLISPIKRSITSDTYYGPKNKPDNHISTFVISNLAIQINKLEQEKKELESKGFHELNQETVYRLHQVRMYEREIYTNKYLLRKYLNELWKQKNPAKE